MPVFNQTLKMSYQHLYDTCVIQAAKYTLVDRIISKLLRHRPVYESLSAHTKVPWYFIAIVHYLEGGQKFTTHLHNGDPLSSRTTHIPKNRPPKGKAPFTWQESAFDALVLQGLHKWPHWDLTGLLFKLEAYNGFGYRKKSINIPSPYLWSFSNHYTTGKFVADGRYNSRAVSAQCGAAVLLRRMEEKQVISLTTHHRIAEIKQRCASVKYKPGIVNTEASKLQSLLNASGYPLRIDGRAGEKTSDACKLLTGAWLPNDPRSTK